MFFTVAARYCDNPFHHRCAFPRAAAPLLHRIRELEVELAAARASDLEQQRAAGVALSHAKHLMDDNMSLSSKVVKDGGRGAGNVMEPAIAP